MSRQNCTVRLADWNTDLALIRRVRQAVFVEEQKVDPALEWDEYETSAQHFLVLCEGVPLATGRITRGGKIGRMAVMRSARGTGLGHRLLQAICDYAKMQGLQKVYLNAQNHAVPFYQKSGFVSQGGEFMEAGIPHIKMVRSFSGSANKQPNH